MNKYLEHILSLPKSLYFCIKCLPFSLAWHLPVWVRFNVILRNTGKIEVKKGTARIKIGFGDVGIFDKRNEKTIWDVSGTVCFKGNAHIGHGSRIVVGKNGKWVVGEDFVCTSAMSLICYKSIQLGGKYWSAGIHY